MLKQTLRSTDCGFGSRRAAGPRKQRRWLMTHANEPGVAVFCSQMWKGHRRTACPAASPPTRKPRHGRGNTASWRTASWCCSTGRKRWEKSRRPRRTYLLAFFGKTRRQLFSSPLYFVHESSETGGNGSCSACGWHDVHSYNPAGPEAGCVEEVAANCAHPKLPPGVLQPAF